MSLTSPTQFKNDLKLIEQSVDKDVKNAVKELIEWNRTLVDSYGELVEQVVSLDDTVSDLVEDQGEGISPETAQILLTTLEQSRQINQAFRTALQSEKNPFDDVTTRQITLLLKNSDQQISASIALVQDLVFEPNGDEGEEEEPSESESANAAGTAGEAADADADAEDDEDDEDDEAQVAAARGDKETA